MDKLLKQLLPVIFVLSLLGLGVIQYRFLVIGLRLSKIHFDQQMGNALKTVGQDLALEHPLTALLSTVIRNDSGNFHIDMDTLKDTSEVFFMDFLEDRLLRQGLKIDFSFALTDESGEEIFLRSREYEETLRERNYKIPLWGTITKDCQCKLVLQLKVHHLLNHLLANLKGLVISCIICLLLILGCFGGISYWMAEYRKLDVIKNDFINNLTHELKTPVFTIGLTTRLLKEQLDHPQSLQYLDIIRHENEEMNTHINNVLELASLKNENKVLHKCTCNVHDLLFPIADQFRGLVLEKGGAFHLKLYAEKSHIWGDIQHLNNVIHNLLDNSLKYSNKKIEIALSTYNHKEKLCISISDQGCGISQDDLSRIFDKFYRVSKGDLHEVKGFGLGLSYVKQIVKMHGGKVQVISTPGEGSIFTVILPVLSYTGKFPTS